WCPAGQHGPSRRDPCGPIDDRSHRAWLARRLRASAALSTGLSESDFRRPDIRSAPAAPGPPSPLRRPESAPNPSVLRASRFAIDASKNIVPSAIRQGYAGHGEVTVFSTALIF